MPFATVQSTADRVVLNVSWETYERLLKDLENSSAPRLAYDCGVLEIMSPHAAHEESNQLIANIVEIVLEEMDTDFRSLRSTTFKLEALKKGFEPDSCFYVRNVERIRNKKYIDMEIDPPPDLVLEIDLTNDSMNKLPIFAAFGVPEAWRFKDSLEIRVLEQGKYVEHEASTVLPVLTTQLISDLLESSQSMTRPQWLRQTRERLRSLIQKQN